MKRARRLGPLLASLLMALPLAALVAPAAPALAAPVYPLEPIPGLEYVAVAPRAFADHVLPLIEWKTQKGVPAQVFELEQIISSYPGRDDAERLHNFLHDLYYNPALNKSPKWLLLVGDGDWDRPIIPIREVFTNSQQDGDLNNSQNWYTTDTYFGNLDSNWDENGNGIFGELSEGDWTPELYVGRVPVDNTIQLDRWVARQLTYEQDPPVGLWMRRAILAGALMDRPNVIDNPLTRADEGYDPFTDNARKVSEEVASEAPARMEFTRLYDYPFEEGGSYSTATDELNVGATKSALDAGASFMVMEGHGYTSNRGVAQYDDPTGTKSIFRSDAEEPALTYDEVLTLANGDMLPFVYVSACYAGDFTDRDDTDFEAFLQAPLGGAIAVVAGNGENFRLENVSGQQGFGNWYLAHQYFHMIFVEGYSQPGKVLGDLKARYNEYYLSQGPTDSVNRNYFRAERVSYNLLGDPEFALWTDTPSALAAAPARQPYVGETRVEIRISDGSGPVAGALVRLTGPGGDVHGRTNVTGSALLPYAVTDTRAFNITVTAANHLPANGTFSPAVPDHNLAFEPGSLSASGVFVRGRPLTVSGTVVARGILPYTGVVIEFRTTNPITGPSIAALFLPQVTPGVPVAISTSVTFDTSGDFLVYATIDPAADQSEDTRADNVAFAQIHINTPPELRDLPRKTLAAGSALGSAVYLPSYAYDRESGALGLNYVVVSVSDPRLTVFFNGSALSFEAAPAWSGIVTVALEVMDGLDVGFANLTVEVTTSNHPPTIEPIIAAEAFVGEPFVLQVRAFDPEGAPLRYTDSSPLFDVQPTGRIAFTPTADELGRFAVTITVSDAKASTSHTFLLSILEPAAPIDVRNPPVVRASAGHTVVIDLTQITADPTASFVTDRQDVLIDPEARTLTYTPASGDARVETIYLTVVRPGEPPTRVALLVDVSSQPASSSGLVFALALLVAAGIVGLTLFRVHQGRSRDEAIFRIEGKSPSQKAMRARGAGTKASSAASTGKDPAKGAPASASREEE